MVEPLLRFCFLKIKDHQLEMCNDTVDGRNPANQMIGRVEYRIIYKVLYIPGGCFGFLPSTVCQE